MSSESNYIIVLCGVFDDNYSHMTRAEFWKYYHQYGDSVEKLIASGDDRVNELLKRSASVTFSLEKLHQMGIKVTTFLDDDFPEQLRSKLKDFCPPLLYSCGDASINEGKFAGYVGSRSVAQEDVNWTEKMVEKNVRQGFGIVTGGAKGIDNTALKHALVTGGRAVVFLPESVETRLKDPLVQEMVLEGRLLLYSHVSPWERRGGNSFVAAAMERNKLIYAMSSATAIVKSDLNKGGTWSGATEALRHGWTKVFVWDNKEYAGNQRLIELGAKPLSDSGEQTNPVHSLESVDEVREETTQMSIFDIL